METINKEQLLITLQQAGYSKQEAEMIIEGMQDVQTGKVYTAEEAYKKLFLKKEKTYA
ncbi:MAG TPA: hypothetical protein PKD96_01690 [Candidatus Absconditabacterales bacterium]|nr:hypothetical protein [Candidatus Absconditabacterales bacterium]HMT26990.1 hypothetical protein [Candidatus Absconditabacterales bacterium]